MIEEKTKEPQSQAPAAPVKGREKLRSFWAKVQISGLLRRHRFRRKTQRHMNDVAKKLRQSTWWCAQGAALLPWPADWPAGAGMPCIPSVQQPFPVRRRCSRICWHRFTCSSRASALWRPTPTTCAGSGALDSNVHPAPVYAGRVRHGLEQDDGPALCAGCAGERPDRWLCGQ